MKKSFPLFLLFALLLLLSMGGNAIASDTQTLNGHYIWDHQGEPGNLDAVFTPDGDNQWRVAFHFIFNGEPHTYRGTAEGSLNKGKLAGTVKNENLSRTFTFHGEVKDGVFEGTHAETRNGRERKTGTLKLE